MTADNNIAVILELLSSRICHDVISPIGAINNGIEFMDDAGDDLASIKEASGLIAHSAQAAAARVQAFRIAYGAGGRDGNIKPEDIQKAFGALCRGDGKIRQSWDPFSPLGLNVKRTGFCKVLMGAMMLAAEALPKGGTVFVDDGKTKTIIRAEGVDATLRDGVEDALNGVTAPESLDPRLVHPYAMGLIAKSYGFQLNVENKAVGAITFTISD